MGSDQLVDDHNAGVSGAAGHHPAPGSGPVGQAPGTNRSAPIRFETSEVPFQQPAAQLYPAESGGRRWTGLTSRLGAGPVVAAALAAVLVAVFAAFITRNPRSLSEQAQSAVASEQQTSSDEASESAEVSASSGAMIVGSSGDVMGQDIAEVTGSVAEFGRATGSVQSGGAAGFGPEVIVEPESILTSDDGGWMTTTTATPTTATPTTATPTTAPTTTSTETTVAETTTTETTVSTTTTETTVPETTTSTEAPPDPEELTVTAIGPGTPDSENPEIVGGRNVVLQAQAGGEDVEDVEYRFRLYVFVFGSWRQVDRSNWRSDGSWSIDLGRYDGRTVRWTVTARDESGQRTPESNPLHIRSGR